MAIKPSEITSRAELRQALAELRAASGLSYEQMAAAAKIATATAYSTLNGPSFPRWGTLKAVLTTFGVGDPRELAQWRQAHRRVEKEGTDDSAGWSGPGTAIRVAECDGLSLGVHRAIAEPGIDPDSLPPYVPRDDDDSGEGVRATVEAMAHDGGFLVVVGDSSVGKTRTLYEAVRASLPSWWLVQPKSADEIRELVDAVPRDARLVVWLDELQCFLGGERGLDAATVRHLLRGPGRVLLVGTLWPVYHSAYAVRPTGTEADPYPTQRAVLELARVLRLGDFSDAERLRAAELAATDPRIRTALTSADHGFTQTMAAGPQLITRWQSADAYAKAVINAALDAARFGMWHPLPAALLRRAAPGYCDDRARANAPGGWFETALTYACATVHGAASPLVPVAGEDMGVIRGYRPADYLLQVAAQQRVEEIGPRQLWDALVEHATDPGDLERLATTARIQCLDRFAAILLKRAVLLGDPTAGTSLLSHLSRTGDGRGVDDAATWVVRHVAVRDPRAVAELMESVGRHGSGRRQTELAERAWPHVLVDDPEAVGVLLRALDDAGQRAAVMSLAARAAEETSVADPDAVFHLWETMGEVGAVATRVTLIARACRECALKPFGVRRLLEHIAFQDGVRDAYDVLVDRLANQAPVGDPFKARQLVQVLLEVGASEAAGVLAGRAATEVSLDNPVDVAMLIETIAGAGAGEALAHLADRVARRAPLDDRGVIPGGVVQLISALERVGATGAAGALAERAARDAPLTSPFIVGELLGTAYLRSGEARTILIDRTAANTPTDPWVWWHLSALHKAGADAAARRLADRAADRMPAQAPDAVTSVLTVLRDIGADGAAARLARRATRDVSLAPFDQPEQLVALLRAMDDGDHKADCDLLADRIVREFPLDDPYPVGRLVYLLATPDFKRLEPWRRVARRVRVFGRAAQALALRAAHEVPLVDINGIFELLCHLEEAGQEAAATALIDRVVREAPIRNGLDRCLEHLHQAGDARSVHLLTGRIARYAPLGTVDDVCALLRTMARIGLDDATEKLATRVAREAPIVLPTPRYSPQSTDKLVDTLRDIGAEGPVRVLADRIADHAPLDPLAGVAILLLVLHQAGCHEQAQRLAERAGRDAVLTDPDGTLGLLSALVELDAASLPGLAMRAARDVSVEDATKSYRLYARLRKAGMWSAQDLLLSRIARRHFGMYLKLAPPDKLERFKYGREPDNTPSAPWHWNDLP